MHGTLSPVESYEIPNLKVDDPLIFVPFLSRQKKRPFSPRERPSFLSVRLL